MLKAVARFFYSNALRLLSPLYVLRLLWRSIREPLYRRDLPGRFGFGRQRAARDCVWIHAVSLGETRAADALVSAMREVDPGMPLLLTHGTATGCKAGFEMMRPGDLQAWLPFDTPGAVKRFLRRHRPSLGVLIETEVWPNLVHYAEREGVPLVLANARLSERSLKRAERFRVLLKPAAAGIDQTLAQSEDDAFRLRKAGARQVRVMGNLKFDMTPPPRLLARGLDWRQRVTRYVVLAASTRIGEEWPLLEAWMNLSGPRPLLVLVPRHPQRFEEVAQLVRESGLRLRRRSEFSELPVAEADDIDVLLGDTVGEMPMYYGMADVALLGGSFAPLGGQNLIEAAACGCPLVMGPHTFNFAQAAQMAKAAGCAQRVQTLDEGVKAAIALACDGQRNVWVQSALAFAAAHRGAAERMAEAALRLRNSGSRPTE
ncbi:MAG: 3-deoxy-D-manno-octulosonic-acid transferase WaaA [Pseudomonadota bacterium]|jgi:3-deoxy-D-manno-octulosonic-acid transferase